MEKYIAQIARGKEILRLCLDRKGDDPFLGSFSLHHCVLSIHK